MEIEESVIAKIRTRRDAGRAKYGTTMERTDLTEVQWLTHAQEEAMHLAIYLEKLIQINEQKDAEIAAQKLHIAHLESCLANMNQDRMRKESAPEPMPEPIRADWGRKEMGWGARKQTIDQIVMRELEAIHAGTATLNPDDDLRELGADSMDLVEIVMAIETTFGITTPDEEMDGIKTVQDLYKLVERYTKK